MKGNQELHDLASLKELAALSNKSAASSYLELKRPQPLSFFSAFFSNSSPLAIWSDIALMGCRRLFAVEMVVEDESVERRFDPTGKGDKVESGQMTRLKQEFFKILTM